jgi:hypothetical protein
MDCKNCQNTLKENACFCDDCGAKVVLKRINFKNLLLEFFIVNFGIDSRFFVTIRKMITQPENVVHEYLQGVRRRYINPFAFLAVGAGLSLIIFNYFADDFIAIQNSMQSEQITDLKEKASLDINQLKNLTEKQKQQKQLEKKLAQMQLDFTSGMWEFMLRYFNLLTFVFLLIYAVLSKWTFWKPHNFGEHIVINGYLYGFTTYLTLVFFFLAILIHPSIYMISILVSMLYYMYAFGKIYKLSIGRNILKLVRFIIGLIVVFIIFMILSLVIGAFIGFMGWIDIAK